MPIQKKSGNLSYAPCMCKLLVFDRNTWNHPNVWKLFVLRITIWSYNCLLRIIIIIISYLKAYINLQEINIKEK